MSRLAHRALLLAAATLVLVPAIAFAAGTPSGTSVHNTATVDYRVGGISQPQITSNDAQFVVDNRIDLTVTTVDGSAVTVLPGSTVRVLTFLVTNTGNTPQDFRLTALDAPAAAFGLTETFDATNVHVWADADGNGVYDPAIDLLDYVDELAADASVHVFVVADIPGTVTEGDVASYDLLANAAAAGTPGSLGADMVEDSGVADDPSAVQVVFGDGAGTIDGARDGASSSRDSYQVANANLTIAKSSVVAEDPFNGTTNPKAIPGARVTYTLDVSNTGAGDADNVSIVDTVPSYTVFHVGSVSAAGTIAYSSDGGATYGYTPVADANGNDTNVDHIRVTYGLIAGGGSSQQITFDVVIE
jgi:uncharacterized repeat protein (TIGR01451 family)